MDSRATMNHAGDDLAVGSTSIPVLPEGVAPFLPLEPGA